MLRYFRSTGVSPVHLSVLFAAALVLIAHQVARWDWWIEDSAIVFSYARNLVLGHGLVPSPGGERVEAYSDPLWVAILAVAYAVGLEGFTIAKPLAMAFGVATQVIVWRTARLALPAHTGPGALLAPLALGLSAGFAIFSASGLENALFGLLLTGAIHRTVVETRDGGFPWAAVLYLLLTLTRPEGIFYAAIGAGAFFVGSLRAGRGLKWIVWWLAIVGVPNVLSEIFRVAYFAWPMPNTFYAKVASRGVAPLEWNSRGWLQLRDWSGRLWGGYFVPVYVAGLIGTRGWRARAGFSAVALLAASLLWPGPEALQALRLWPDLPPPPEALVLVRVLALLAAGGLLPLLALGAPGGLPRALCGLSVFYGLSFQVTVNGDWMGAYRFISLIAPQLAVLFAVGLTELVDRFEGWLSGATSWGAGGWLAASLGLGLLAPPNLSQTRDHSLYNNDETPQMVHRRVDYLRSIARLTFYDDPIANLDIDQGAFLWWAPDFRQYDYGRLVEVPTGRHWWQQQAFVREYVFQEARPTFVNCSGWWASVTGFRTYPEWEADFFDLPGYRTLRGNRFSGIAARRELVMAARWDGEPGRKVTFEWNLALEGAAVPAPWSPGLRGYLEAPFAVTAARKAGEGATVYAFLSRDGRVAASWDLPMGYGIYPMETWRTGHVFRGRYAVPVPGDLAPGRYDLGFVVRGPRGRIIPAIAAEEGATLADPVFAVGEVRFPGAVEVVAGADFGARVAGAREHLLRAAESGGCEDAEAAWIALKRHRPTQWAWHDELRPQLAEAMASCWAQSAESRPDDAVARLARAHAWDPYSAELERVGGPIGERLFAEGLGARQNGEWEFAYRQFSAVLSFQPWRSWARRWAEEARDHRLGLVGFEPIGTGDRNDPGL